MKEKKIVLSVVLGVSLVALITALVAGLADSLSLLIDGLGGYSQKNVGYVIAIGVLELCLSGLGIAFVALKIRAMVKPSNGTFIAETVLAAVIGGFFVITLIVLRVTQPTNSQNELFAQYYALFTAYLGAAITVTVSALLAYLSSLFLNRLAKKDEEAKPENQNEQ